VGISLPCLPGTSAPSRLARSRRWLATLTLLASLAAAVAGPGNGPSGGHAADDLQHRPRARDDPESQRRRHPTSYCDAQDTTIPGAAAFLAGTGAHRPT